MWFLGLKDLTPVLGGQLRQFFLGSGLGQKFIIVTLDVLFIITIVKVM